MTKQLRTTTLNILIHTLYLRLLKNKKVTRK